MSKNSSRPVPTDLELELLKVIWQRGPSTVREVYQDLLTRREIAYTTVLTMMGVLERKGHLKKKAGPRAYIFTPSQPQDRVEEGMINEFVNRVFDGSARPLLLHLVGEREIPYEEIEELERLLREKKLKK